MENNNNSDQIKAETDNTLFLVSANAFVFCCVGVFFACRALFSIAGEIYYYYVPDSL